MSVKSLFFPSFAAWQPVVPHGIRDHSLHPLTPLPPLDPLLTPQGLGSGTELSNPPPPHVCCIQDHPGVISDPQPKPRSLIASSHRFLVARVAEKQKENGGYADRIKIAVNVFLIALLTHRVFLLDWPDMDMYFHSPFFNWQYSQMNGTLVKCVPLVPMNVLRHAGRADSSAGKHGAHAPWRMCHTVRHKAQPALFSRIGIGVGKPFSAKLCLKAHVLCEMVWQRVHCLQNGLKIARDNTAEKT